MKTRKMIMAKTANGQEISFDANRVECYTTVKPGSGEYVEVTLYSGKHLFLSDDMDYQMYGDMKLSRHLDDILWRNEE